MPPGEDGHYCCIVCALLTTIQQMTTRVDSESDHRIVRLYQDLQAAAQRFWSTPQAMNYHFSIVTAFDLSIHPTPIMPTTTASTSHADTPAPPQLLRLPLVLQHIMKLTFRLSCYQRPRICVHQIRIRSVPGGDRRRGACCICWRRHQRNNRQAAGIQTPTSHPLARMKSTMLMRPRQSRQRNPFRHLSATYWPQARGLISYVEWATSPTFTRPEDTMVMSMSNPGPMRKERAHWFMSPAVP